MTTQIARTKQYMPAEGVIDLAIGQPDPSLLPADLMQQAAEHRIANGHRDYLAYGSEVGDQLLREAIAALLKKRIGQSIDPEHLMITNGSSGALDLVCTRLASKRATVFVEEPTYFLARQIFGNHHLKTVSLPMDDQGLVVDELEKLLKSSVEMSRPAFLYTIPTFHNPSGVTMSHERRRHLAEVAEQHKLTIVADEVYQLLGYDQTPPPPLATYSSRADIISLSSFSKILAPGLRLGWLQSNTSVLATLTGSGVLKSGGGLNPYIGGFVRSAIELGLLEKHIDHLHETYRSRMHALSNAIRKHLPPDIDFAEPVGGYFAWLGLPGDIETDTLLHKSRKHQAGLKFQPGANFSSEHGLHNYVRLCFAMHNEDELDEGVQRLAKLIEAHG